MYIYFIYCVVNAVPNHMFSFDKDELSISLDVKEFCLYVEPPQVSSKIYKSGPHTKIQRGQTNIKFKNQKQQNKENTQDVSQLLHVASVSCWACTLCPGFPRHWASWQYGWWREQECRNAEGDNNPATSLDAQRLPGLWSSNCWEKGPGNILSARQGKQVLVNA